MSLAQQQAFLLAATHSGAGKTTITMGLLAALARRGLTVQPFKCGPDFIDPTLHEMVSGRVSRNLDLRMCGANFVRSCFNRHRLTADAALVEGVMGLFDGGEASSAALAKALGLPVVLIVDSRSCAESMAAVVKGFEILDPQVKLAGVILNRVGSPRHLELLQNAIGAYCQTPVIGALPRDADFSIPERHLGLAMGQESPLAGEQVQHLAQTIIDHIDLDRLLELCQIALPDFREIRPEQDATGQARANAKGKIRLGIAQDPAFCFYYQDNLDILAAQGVELVPFSPLRDQTLPAHLDAIYLGGGYPELYAAELANNEAMRREIREWSSSNRPIYAECGGFMYLCEGIIDLNGHKWPMAGVFPSLAQMRKKLSRLGYREAHIKKSCLWGTDATLYGHEFHYSDIEAMPPQIAMAYNLPNGREEGYQIRNTLASYIHLHFGRTPEIVSFFIKYCQALRP